MFFNAVIAVRCDSVCFHGFWSFFFNTVMHCCDSGAL